MNPKHMKKPGSGGSRYPGQQRNFGKQAAYVHRNSKRFDTPRAYAATPTAENFYSQEIDQFSVGSSGWASGCCPFHDDHNPSFAMNLDTGSYFCRSSSCGAKGGSLISFVCNLYGLSVRDAYRFLESRA